MGTSTQISVLVWIGLTFIPFLVSADAQSDQKTFERNLQVMEETATKLCSTVDAEGKSRSSTASADARAELNAALKKLVNVGGGLSGKYESSEYAGVLQKDLASLKSQELGCKQARFSEMYEGMLAKPRVKTAQRPQGQGAGSAGSSAVAPPPPISVTQDNRESSGTNIGYAGSVTVVPKAPPLLLTTEQVAAATEALKHTRHSVSLILPSLDGANVDGRTTQLGRQILAIFGPPWTAKPAVLGIAGFPKVITIVGTKENESVREVAKAFDAAHIQYTVDPNAYAGPGSLQDNPADVTVTIPRPD